MRSVDFNSLPIIRRVKSVDDRWSLIGLAYDVSYKRGNSLTPTRRRKTWQASKTCKVFDLGNDTGSVLFIAKCGYYTLKMGQGVKALVSAAGMLPQAYRDVFTASCVLNDLSCLKLVTLFSQGVLQQLLLFSLLSWLFFVFSSSIDNSCGIGFFLIFLFAQFVFVFLQKRFKFNGTNLRERLRTS